MYETHTRTHTLLSLSTHLLNLFHYFTASSITVAVKLAHVAGPRSNVNRRTRMWHPALGLGVAQQSGDRGGNHTAADKIHQKSDTVVVAFTTQIMKYSHIGIYSSVFPQSGKHRKTLGCQTRSRTQNLSIENVHASSIFPITFCLSGESWLCLLDRSQPCPTSLIQSHGFMTSGHKPACI